MNHNKKDRSLRVLVIGSLNGAHGGNGAGGTVISLRCLVDELQNRQDVELRVIDLGCSGDKTGLLKDVGRAMAFIKQAITCIPRVDVVSLHLSNPSTLGLPGLLLSRVFRKPLIIRKFGGNDYRMSFKYSWPRIAEFILHHADLYLAQSHNLVDQARSRGIAHCRWFPTHRPMNPEANPNNKRTQCRRFVYVGQVREYKGIQELVEAAEQLDATISVDVFGPLFDDLPANLFNNCKRVFYKGCLYHRHVECGL